VAVNQAAEGGAIGAAMLDRLHAIVRELRLVDDHLGGGRVLALVEPEVRFAIRLMRRGSFTPDSRTRLYRIIGELTQLAGWAAYDDGKHRLAQRYYQTALYAAHVSGDRLLGVYVLSMLAFQASNLDQYRESLLLLDSARHSGKGVNTPGVLSMLDAWESRALARGQPRGFPPCPWPRWRGVAPPRPTSTYETTCRCREAEIAWAILAQAAKAVRDRALIETASGRRRCAASGYGTGSRRPRRRCSRPGSARAASMSCRRSCGTGRAS
jgi:hypothetical protein